ncbi:MAG: hypothetical protein ACRYFU_19350, partial [Janthinobacterium lividum]
KARSSLMSDGPIAPLISGQVSIVTIPQQGRLERCTRRQGDTLTIKTANLQEEEYADSIGLSTDM